MNGCNFCGAEGPLNECADDTLLCDACHMEHLTKDLRDDSEQGLVLVDVSGTGTYVWLRPEVKA